ncbi:MAG: hypothetical protein ABI779_12060 [Acidobacteriota bacterium]
MTRTERRALLQKIGHYLTAFTIGMKGFIKLEHPHGNEAAIALFFASAVYITVMTILHDRLHRHATLLDASVLGIECIVTGILASIYVREGSHGLQYLFALASVLFAVAFFVRLRKGRTAHHGEVSD